MAHSVQPLSFCPLQCSSTSGQLLKPDLGCGGGGEEDKVGCRDQGARKPGQGLGRELSVPGVPLTLGDSSQVPKALGQNAPALEPGGFLLPGESVPLSLLRFTAVNKSLVYRCAAFPERDCFPAQHILLWKPINEPASFQGCHCPPPSALRDLMGLPQAGTITGPGGCSWEIGVPEHSFFREAVVSTTG